MFFLLQDATTAAPDPTHIRRFLGVVVADSIEKAAEKIGGRILIAEPTTGETHYPFVILEDGRSLEEMPEFTRALEDLAKNYV